MMVYKLWFSLALLAGVGNAMVTPNTVSEPRVEPVVVLAPAIQNILHDLRQCESGGKDSAINLVDLDFTPSYGRYQFKPGTLYAWANEYGVLTDVELNEIMNVIMDGELQEQVLVKAIEKHGKEKTWWLSQFPQCSAKYRFWERLI